MQGHIVELMTGVTGSLGFCLIFRLNRRLIPATLVGSFLCWAVYLLSLRNGEDVFVPSLISSVVCAAYAQVAARVLKAPATVFLIPEVLPLIPGSGLYYTMSHAVQKHWFLTKYFGYRTMMFAMGIAAGICIVGVVNDTILRCYHFYSKRNSGS